MQSGSLLFTLFYIWLQNTVLVSIKETMTNERTHLLLGINSLWGTTEICTEKRPLNPE